MTEGCIDDVVLVAAAGASLLLGDGIKGFPAMLCNGLSVWHQRFRMRRKRVPLVTALKWPVVPRAFCRKGNGTTTGR
jgi:hypothetical protein